MIWGSHNWGDGHVWGSDKVVIENSTIHFKATIKNNKIKYEKKGCEVK